MKSIISMFFSYQKSPVPEYQEDQTIELTDQKFMNFANQEKRKTGIEK